MDNQRIAAVEWARLKGWRPRKAGSNARLGEHGIAVQVPILRVTTEDGTRGFGAGHAGPERAATLLGLQLGELFEAGRGVREPRHFAYVEWDEATTTGIDASGYAIRDGWVLVPNMPGFGLALDETAFQRAIASAGFSRSL